MKKRIASLLLAAAMLLSLGTFALAEEEQPLVEGSGGAARFTDVPRDYTFYDDIDTVVAAGLFFGTTPTTFSPYRSMTRAMFVVVLSRLEGLSVERVDTPTAFSDVPSNYWAAGAVAWATQNGIVEGYGDGTFRPAQAITRAQIAALVYRYIHYKGYDVVGEDGLILKDYTDDPDTPAAPQFTDYNEASSVFRSSLDYCRAHGLIRGFNDGSYRPNISVTRAQVAAILHRIIFVIQETYGLKVTVLPLSEFSAKHGAVPTVSVTRLVSGTPETVTQIQAGDTVRINHAPNSGYYAAITLYRDAAKTSRITGSTVRITRSFDGTYSTFIMPNYDVWVEIVYERSGGGGGGGGGGRTGARSELIENSGDISSGVGANGTAGLYLDPEMSVRIDSGEVDANTPIYIKHQPDPGYQAKITIFHRPEASSSDSDWVPYYLNRNPETGELDLVPSDTNGGAYLIPLTDTLNASWFKFPDGQDVRVRVEFVPIPVETTYTLTLAAVANGTVSVTGGEETLSGGSESVSTKAKKGDTITVTATPADGYRVKSVSAVQEGSTENLITGSEYTFTMPEGNVTVTVEFELIPVEVNTTVSVTATGSGTVSVKTGVSNEDESGWTDTLASTSTTGKDKKLADKVKVDAENPGFLLTLTPDTASGYSIKSVKVNGTDVTASLTAGTDGSCTYKAELIEDQDNPIEVVFVAYYYALGVNGEVYTKDGSQTFPFEAVVGEDSANASVTHLRGDVSFINALKALDGNVDEEKAVLVDSQDYDNETLQNNEFQAMVKYTTKQFDDNKPSLNVPITSEQLQNDTLVKTILNNAHVDIVKEINRNLTSDTTKAAVEAYLQGAVIDHFQDQGYSVAPTFTGHLGDLSIPGITDTAEFTYTNAGNYKILSDAMKTLLGSSGLKAKATASIKEEPIDDLKYLSAQVDDSVSLTGAVKGTLNLNGIEITAEPGDMKVNLDGTSYDLEDLVELEAERNISVAIDKDVSGQTLSLSSLGGSFKLSESSYANQVTGYFAKMEGYLDILRNILNQPFSQNAYNQFNAFYGNADASFKVTRNTDGNITKISVTSDSGEAALVEIDDANVSIRALADETRYHEIYDFVIDQLNGVRTTLNTDLDNSAIYKGNRASYYYTNIGTTAAAPQLASKQRVVDFLTDYQEALALILAEDDPTVEFVYQQLSTVTGGDFLVSLNRSTDSADDPRSMAGNKVGSILNRLGLKPEIKGQAHLKLLEKEET